MSDTVPVRDGRTARCDRNRQAVLDAILELFGEDIDPTPEVVALRSGVSPRSVYRYFEDRDELLRAAIERQIEIVYPIYRIEPLGEGPLDDRIETFVSSRLRLFEEVADSSRAARLRAARVAAIGAQVSQTQRALLEQVEQQFGPELNAQSPRTRRATLAAIDALCQFESLDYLRRTRGLSQLTTRGVLTEVLDTLLAPRESTDDNDVNNNDNNEIEHEEIR